MSTDPEPCRHPVDPGTRDTDRGRRTHPLTPLVQAWIWLVGLALVLLREWAGGQRYDLGTLLRFDALGPKIVLPVGVLVIAANGWSWWTTRYAIEDEELRVEQRGLTHRLRRAAYTRIAAVDVVQPFAARLLGLAELRIHLSGDETLTLRYVRRTDAVELRQRLLAASADRLPDDPRDPLAVRAQADPASEHAAAPDPAERPQTRASRWNDAGGLDRVLLRVKPAELVLGALASVRLLALLAGLAAPVVLSLALGEPAVFGGVLPVALALWTYLSSQVARQWNYTLAQTPVGLRITRGLSSLTSETLPVERISMIRIREPVLWRLLGRARVELTIPGGIGNDENPSSLVALPIGRRADVRTVLELLWPGLDPAEVPTTAAPPRTRWIKPLSWRFLAAGADADLLLMRAGWWTRTTWLVPHARVLGAHADAGPLRRRLGLADVWFATAGGLDAATTTLDARSARALLDAEMARARAARAISAAPANTQPTQG